MSDYAIILAGGKQYLVREGDRLKIEKLETEEKKVEFQPLLVKDGDQLHIGSPLVEGAKVSATVVGTGKGAKVVVFKKRRREQYRNTRGHRQPYTEVEIKKIATAGRKTKSEKKEEEN
ncbi:MAG: 50S ribosomal protein L21 [Acidobacteria bacterium]|nr:50S ribosomal protein L21 [Acidobacteriota bacterium]